MDLTHEEIATITGGRAVGPEAVARGFGFDSRTLEPGSGFVALRSERDGHAFVADTLPEARPSRSWSECLTASLVHSSSWTTRTRRSRALGVEARDRLEGAAVIGITGSAGKTSTKDLTAAALAPAFVVHASVASFNNEIGLPVSLLDAPTDAGAVVLEMGARFAGNIAELCAIARPSIGVITHIGLAHAEHLGGADGIAAVKGELVDALPADGLAVLNADCEHVETLRRRSAAPVLTVGVDPGADLRTSAVRLGPDLRATFRLDSPWGSEPDLRLAVRGVHQVANAAQAAAVALHLGVPLAAIAGSLSTATSASWRMELSTSGDDILVLNDAYNASPSSVRAALDTFGRLPVRGRRIAVLGEMRELGVIAAAEHAAIGGVVAAAGVSVLVTVGSGTDELADSAARGGRRGLRGRIWRRGRRRAAHHGRTGRRRPREGQPAGRARARRRGTAPGR